MSRRQKTEKEGTKRWGSKVSGEKWNLQGKIVLGSKQPESVPGRGCRRREGRTMKEKEGRAIP